MKIKAAAFASGRGSNLQALCDACAAPDFPVRLPVAVTDRPDSGAADVALHNNMRLLCVTDPAGYGPRLAAELIASGINIVCLAGFMKILKPAFLDAWHPRPILNIHPSLLPAYPGLDTHKRALADGMTKHGATVHHVTADLDAGPTVMQAEVPVLPGDTPSSLAARVLEAEHLLYPEVLAKIAADIP